MLLNKQSYLDHLECTKCGQKYDPLEKLRLCIKCGKVLFAKYNLENIDSISKLNLYNRRQDLWRFNEIITHD